MVVFLVAHAAGRATVPAITVPAITVPAITIAAVTIAFSQFGDVQRATGNGDAFEVIDRTLGNV